jgi:hypothetical protein
MLRYDFAIGGSLAPRRLRLVIFANYPVRPFFSIAARSQENPLWGASRIHGELLILRSHADAIAAVDLCVVRMLAFDLLFLLVVLGHSRRQLA